MKVLQHGKHWVAPEYPKRKHCDCGCVFVFEYEDTVANMMNAGAVKFIAPNAANVIR